MAEAIGLSVSLTIIVMLVLILLIPMEDDNKIKLLKTQIVNLTEENKLLKAKLQSKTTMKGRWKNNNGMIIQIGDQFVWFGNSKYKLQVDQQKIYLMYPGTDDVTFKGVYHLDNEVLTISLNGHSYNFPELNKGQHNYTCTRS